MLQLLCIDFSNLLIRHNANLHGTAQNQYGQRMQGAVGALGQVHRSLRRLQPTHLLIARDSPRSESFRRALFDDYKAHRPAADPELGRQFEVAYRAAQEIFGWPVVAVDSYEADDVMASACDQFPGRCQILTGDKDMLALCSDRVEVLLLRPGGEVTVDRAGCRNLVGVWPEQVRCYKALVGDASDGIPGVTGIGPKSAVKLLERYNDLQTVLDRVETGKAIEGIAPHLAAKVINGVEQAELSYLLAGLVTDLPVDVSSLACPEPVSEERGAAQLEELGLGDLRRSLWGSEPRPAQSSHFDPELAFRAALAG